jgi:HSP20 family protein
MRALLPPNGVTNLRREMDRLFDRMWERNVRVPDEFTPLLEWTPALDVYELNEEIVVKAEIPGIEPKDVQVNLNNQMLTIAGEKKFEKELKDEKFYRMERASGSFARTVNLPTPVDGSKVTALFKNGILTVTLPKSPVAKGSMIPIKFE